MRLRVRLLSVVIIMAVLSACSNSGNTPVSTPPGQAHSSAKLIVPANNDNLERWLKAELVKNYQYRETRYYYAAMDVKSDIAAPVSTTTSGQTSNTTPQTDNSTGSYSTTNVQEKGVDEGDQMKTEGNYIYLIRGTHFFILNKESAEAKSAIISDIDVKDTINELHLSGSRITLITTSYTPLKTAAASSPMFSATATRVYNYDVSNPVTPVQLSRFDFPGTLQGTRRINSTIYVIVNYRIDLPSPVYASNFYQPINSFSMEAYNLAGAQASAENLKRIEALTLGEMLPTYSQTLYTAGKAGATTVAPVVNSSDIYIPEPANGTDMSLVISLDNSKAEPVVTSSGVISSWCQIYMSPASLYLASSNNWAWIEPVQGRAQATKSPEPSTALHKFALADGGGKPVYKGSGIVPGWVNNQFSMGEYNGYLRVGTTRGGWWGEGTSNRLAILNEQGGNLVETGKIEGLAKGEKIYSMRFDRDRGYMVTFRQTDPLFTFDLSDPVNPIKAGELKVNGFATYIHLVGQDNNQLLTIGPSADDTGRVTGNKLQLFDVTNISKPEVISTCPLGEGWSGALYDHHAFLYFKQADSGSGLLAIPYYSYYTNAASGTYSSGLWIFDVNAAGISKRGEIQAKAVSNGYGLYADTVDRSLIIDSNIYAIAHRTVTVADIATLDIKNTVNLPESYEYYIFYGQVGGVTAATAL